MTNLDYFDHKDIEPRWQAQWKNQKIFEVETDLNKPKYYILEMFPYPSGTIHMGHVRNYTIGDVMARYKKKRGFNVMHPMGWDAFGLPAENAAIKRKTHPAKWTHSNIGYMRTQFERMGWLFDWRREVATCTPDYYKWEQLFFIKLYEKGLAYRKLSSVNWCNSCNTVLANEQVEDGKCWRCENDVTTKELTQWFLKVTAYAEELLEASEKLTGWPEKVRLMQKNWIGKSFGAEVLFEVADGLKKGTKIPIFTTRPDTIFGVTYVSLAPEHPLTLELARGAGHELEVSSFVERVRKQDKIKRTDDSVEKEGVALGVNVINPVNGEKVPVYAANFVLMDYGTGAVMAVPAHDERDHAFAKKYSLPILKVIETKEGGDPVQGKATTEYGVLQHSGEFSSLTSEQAIQKIPQWLEKNGVGKQTVNYRLRDWGISRQRYWGAPIPMVHCVKCGVVPVAEKDLPVVLPEDVQFTGEGPSPLTQSESFLNTSCPKCAGPGKRETDTMDTFMESSWYFMRFCTPKQGDLLNQVPFEKKDLEYWLPIDQYIGGVEHATMHLLYFRFYHRALQDLGIIPSSISREPAERLLNQGIVYKDGAKMSKSKGNIVDPDDLIEKFGADTTRLFVLFAAPPEKVLEWNDAGVEGSYRFLGRVWRLVQQNLETISSVKPWSKSQIDLSDTTLRKLRTKTHQTLKKVTDDLDQDFRFNTAISSTMELVNEIYAVKEFESDEAKQVLRESIETVVRLLNPFAPHLSEELWKQLGHNTLLSMEPWVDYDPKATELDQINIVIQVGGKHRATLQVAKNIAEKDLLELAEKDAKVASHLQGKEKVKTIVVPGKLINFVVKG